MVTVYLVDDHPVSRWGLQHMLQGTPGIQITGVFASPGELLAVWPDSSAPDAVLLDLYLGDETPCVPLVSELATRAKVIVFSASQNPTDIVACRNAGASGFLHKGTDGAILVEALHGCLEGKVCFPEADATQVPAHTLDGLSSRELQVLAYIASGYTHDQTARRLGVSPHTVDTYLKRLRKKIGVGNKAHLTRVALAAGIRLDQGGVAR